MLRLHELCKQVKYGQETEMSQRIRRFYKYVDPNKICHFDDP